MELSRAGMVWSQQELEQLRTNFGSGMDLEELMRTQGRSAYAIIAKLQEMGLIVLVGRSSYHKVVPDAWITSEGIHFINKQSKGGAK
jgi:chromosome segregation and condensation protein ScpB